MITNDINFEKFTEMHVMYKKAQNIQSKNKNKAPSKRK